jgi:hypothetical protein
MAQAVELDPQVWAVLLGQQCGKLGLDVGLLVEQGLDGGVERRVVWCRERRRRRRRSRCSWNGGRGGGIVAIQTRRDALSRHGRRAADPSPSGSAASGECPACRRARRPSSFARAPETTAAGRWGEWGLGKRRKKQSERGGEPRKGRVSPVSLPAPRRGRLEAVGDGSTAGGSRSWSAAVGASLCASTTAACATWYSAIIKRRAAASETHQNAMAPRYRSCRSRREGGPKWRGGVEAKGGALRNPREQLCMRPRLLACEWAQLRRDKDRTGCVGPELGKLFGAEKDLWVKVGGFETKGGFDV